MRRQRPEIHPSSSPRITRAYVPSDIVSTPPLRVIPSTSGSQTLSQLEPASIQVEEDQEGSSVMPLKTRVRKEVPFVDGLKAKEVQDVPLEEIDLQDRSFQYRLG